MIFMMVLYFNDGKLLLNDMQIMLCLMDSVEINFHLVLCYETFIFGYLNIPAEMNVYKYKF